MRDQPTILPIGQCPYCDTVRGRHDGWAMGPDGWAEMKRVHDAGHVQVSDRRAPSVGVCLKCGANLTDFTDVHTSPSRVVPDEEPTLASINVLCQCGHRRGDHYDTRRLNEGAACSCCQCREFAAPVEATRVLATKAQRAEFWDDSDYMFIIDELESELSTLRSESESLRRDKERLDWLEEWPSLHRNTEIYYVVDGFTVDLLRGDGDECVKSCKGENIREAIDVARAYLAENPNG